MSENLPPKIEPPVKAEKTPSMEGASVVENMSLSWGAVLIKVTFPRSDDVAKVFMLIQPPVSEEGSKNYERLMEKVPEKGREREIREDTFKIMNSPLVFRNKKQAQEWFDISHNYTPTERRAIAEFLEIEYKED